MALVHIYMSNEEIVHWLQLDDAQKKKLKQKFKRLVSNEKLK